MSVVTNYNFAHRGLVAFSLGFVYLFLKIIFLCYFLHFLCFDNEDQWYEPSCNGIWQFFLPICQTFRRMVRKTMGKWFFTLQMKWGTACPQVLPNLTHKEAAFQASMETWKNLSILLMQTFLWGWITLKIFSLILLDMPLENVLSSWPVLQQIPLPFPSYGRSWRSYLRNWTLLLQPIQPLFLWGQVPSQRSLLKTSQHNSVTTQDVESRAILCLYCSCHEKCQGRIRD